MTVMTLRWSVGLSAAIASFALTASLPPSFAQSLTQKQLQRQSATFDPATCQFNGIDLYGDVQIVDSASADINVKTVTRFPELNVQWVSGTPERCGQWREVSASPDFTIQYVESFPDLEIVEDADRLGLP